MKIGVIGKGFVGGALVHGFTEKGIEDISVYDPIVLPDSDIEDVLGSDIVFVCVPTLMSKSGEIDMSIIHNTFDALEDGDFSGVVVLKSTTTPVHVNALKNRHYLRLVTNPEYLTQRNAEIEFLNPKWIVVGGDPEDRDVVGDFYASLWPDVPVTRVGLEAAMMGKYMCNCWFSVKVSLMNEFYRLWNSFDFVDRSDEASWLEAVEAFSADIRVGPTHLDVPGPDGDFGFGGTCFPKDLNALMHVAKSREIIHNVLEAAWETNKEVRYNRDWIR